MSSKPNGRKVDHELSKTNFRQSAKKNNANPTDSFQIRLSDSILRKNSCTDGNKLQLVGLGITVIDKISITISSKIRVLYLSNNSIISLQGIEQFSLLESLSCSNNKISSVKELRRLSALRFLEKLSIDGNEVCCYPYIRELLIHTCPNLTQLDYSLGKI